MAARKTSKPPEEILRLWRAQQRQDTIVRLSQEWAVPACTVAGLWVLAGKVTLADVNLHGLFEWNFLPVAIGWGLGVTFFILWRRERALRLRVDALPDVHQNPLYEKLKPWLV